MLVSGFSYFVGYNMGIFTSLYANCLNSSYMCAYIHVYIV